MNMQLTLALRYLNGRKLRTFLTTLAIVFGVMVIFAINSMLPAFTEAFQANAMALGGEVDVSVSSKTGDPFPMDTLDRVAAVEGVRVAAGSLERIIGLPPDYFDGDPSLPDRAAAVNLVGIDPAAERSVRAFNVIEGRYLEDTDTNAAIIPVSLAETAGVGVGDTLALPTVTGLADLTVVGLLPQQIMPGNERVYANLPYVQEVMGAPGQINIITANFDLVNPDQRPAIEQNIQAAVGSSFSLGVIQAGAEMLANIQISQMIFNLLGVLALAMGGFIILNTFRTIVAERRRDIGMLRSIGASRGTIVGLILFEGLIQGVLGTLAGLVLGFLAAQAMLGFITRMLAQFMNLQMGGVPLIPSVLLMAVAGGVGITLLAGLLPARAASRVAPLDALRPAAAEVSYKKLGGVWFWIGVVLLVLAVLALLTKDPSLTGLGSLLFIAGLILASPALIYPLARFFGNLITLAFARDGTSQLAEGNLSRQPSRAAITAMTTLISMTVVVMIASLIASIMISFKSMLTNSLRSDYLLLPPSVSTWGLDVGAGQNLADDLRAVEGVQTVSTLRFAATQINDVAVGLLGIEPEAYLETSGLTFIEGDAETAFAAMENGRGMIINGLLGSRALVQLGDTVTVLTPTGEATYTVVAIASDFLNAKTNTGYISQANIAADFGRTEDVFYQINLAENASKEQVEAAFKLLLAPYPQFKLVDGQEYYQQNAALFDTMFMGIVMLALFLAIPSLIAMINTLAIGVLERRREIGMLRAVGSTRRQIWRIILFEAIILSSIGTAFGVLAGLYLGYTTTTAFDAIGFPLEYVFPAAGVALVIALGLVLGAFAAMIPARQAARMQIVEALRYE